MCGSGVKGHLTFDFLLVKYFQLTMMNALILNLHRAVLHEFSLPWHIYDFVDDYILGLGDMAKNHLCIFLAELRYSLYIYIFLLHKKKKKNIG